MLYRRTRFARSLQAVHSVAHQIVSKTIAKTVMTWPQRILVADTDVSPFGGEVGVEVHELQEETLSPHVASQWSTKTCYDVKLNLVMLRRR